MKTYTYYEPIKPDTVSGYSIKVSTIYSSFNKEEIDVLSEELKRNLGSGIISEYKAVKDNEE